MRNKVFLFCFFAIHCVMGQNSTHDTYLGIGTGRRTIAKTEKNQKLPKTIDSIVNISNVKYYLEPKKHETSFEAVPIKAAKLKIVEPLEKLQNGYVKAAAGTYIMPFLDLNYNSTRSKLNSWGINALHHSALGNIKDVGVNKFSDNRMGGFYKHFFDKQDLLLGLNYSRDVFHYYGFSQDSLYVPQEYIENSDTTRQAYNLIEFSSEFKKRNIGRDTSKLNYKGWLNYHFLANYTGSKENYFLIGAQVGKFLKKEEFITSIEIDVNNLNQIQWDNNGEWELSDNLSSTNAIVKLNPHIYSRGKNWKAKAGLSMQSNIDYEAKFYFYPDLECSYSLFNDLFIPYLGLNGGLKRNNLNSLRNINPFIADDDTIQNSNQRIHIFGGIRGSVSNNITFNVSAGFEKLNDMYFFVPDTISSYENKFQLMYDNLDKTSFSGQLSYKSSEKLKLFAKGEFLFYSLSDEANKAWQLPNYKFTFSGWYDLADKIILKSSIFLIGSRAAFSHSEPLDLEPSEYDFSNNRYEYQLKPFIDMNLSVEYRYNKRISAFINFNNFAAKKYQRWTNYPVQSINIFGGATFTF